MTLQEALAFIDKPNGKIFSVEFRKRSTGEIRIMNCRRKCLSHLRGGPEAYNPDDKGLVIVFDMRKGYRAIPREGITRIKVLGEWKDVTQ